MFVLICSLCLLAAELKLVQWENQGLLSPGLFPLSAQAAATTLQAGDRHGQDRGGGTTTVTRSQWQDHGSTLVTSIPGAFASCTYFLASAKPSELLAWGFCTRGVWGESSQQCHLSAPVPGAVL